MWNEEVRKHDNVKTRLSDRPVVPGTCRLAATRVYSMHGYAYAMVSPTGPRHDVTWKDVA